MLKSIGIGSGILIVVGLVTLGVMIWSSDQTTEVVSRVEQANDRTTQAVTRVEQATSQTTQAVTKVEHASSQATQAVSKVEQALRQKETLEVGELVYPYSTKIDVFRVDAREDNTAVLRHIPSPTVFERAGCDWDRVRDISSNLSDYDFRIDSPYREPYDPGEFACIR
ncbi:MAG: hypothetical protein OXN86_03120 [Chloroflexota bacterium]|nr:hypothetical protein [Chloroflexota bacterium]MDE2891484.1 hypothetical protein [Chloroflexota bacterium]